MNSRTLSSLAALLLGACAATPVPDPLRPDAGAVLALTTSARGVQIYECRDARWTFVAPQAELFDAAGHSVGTHGAGPFWQVRDGSRVVASVAARADAPVAGSIPWLLLAARPDTTTPGTRGVLTGVTHIQRVDTGGGVAPTGSCQPSGQPLHVPYVATYHFYKRQHPALKPAT